MPDRYHVFLDGEVTAAFPEPVIRSMMESGAITQDTPLCMEDSEVWDKAKRMLPQKIKPPPIPQRLPGSELTDGSDRYCALINGETAEPQSLSELKSMLLRGEIARDTPLCREGGIYWEPAAEVLYPRTLATPLAKAGRAAAPQVIYVQQPAAPQRKSQSLLGCGAIAVLVVVGLIWLGSRSTNPSVASYRSISPPAEAKSQKSIPRDINKDQLWLAENVFPGDPWPVPGLIERFGAYEQLELTRGNPKILRVYYFPKPHFTIIVNAYKQSVSIWRWGKETE